MRKSLLVFLILITCGKGWSRSYALFLDPKHAESNLGKWKIPDPTYELHWLRILGPLKYRTYRVKKGDTLAKISKKMLKKPDYWPKLWEVNQEVVSNPYNLPLGKILEFWHEDMERVPASLPIPVVKLLPVGRNKVATDLIQDTLMRPTMKQNHRLRHFVLGNEEILGNITGAYMDKNQFLPGDELYIGIYDHSKVQEGDRVAIVHEEDRLRDIPPDQTFTTGKLMQLVGEAEILHYGDDLAKAVITGGYGSITRGDKVVKLPTLSTTDIPIEPPLDITARIILGEEPSQRSFYNGTLVLLSRGSDGGMKNGYFFRVFDDTDPQSTHRELVEPEFKAEIQVVYAGKMASVGFIRRARSPLKIGDTLIPSKLFTDPPPAPTRDMSQVEF